MAMVVGEKMQKSKNAQVTKNIINIVSCDCQYLSKSDIACKRLKGRNDYHILYIAKGCCHVYENGEELKAEAGSVVAYFPGEPQQYTFFANEKTISYYVHFIGENLDSVLRELGFEKRRIANIGISSTIGSLFDKMITEFQLKRAFYEYYCQGLLFNILSVIGRKINDRTNDIRHETNTRMNEIRKLMHSQFDVTKSVEEYAKLCNLSESRFSHIFKEEFGISPKHYMIKVKVQKAKDLLKDTDLSIFQVAEMVGIDNQNYFSRLFKKHTGQSPNEYRNKL